MDHSAIHLPVYAQMSSRVMAKVRSGSFTTLRVSLVRLAPSCFPRWTKASPRARNLNHVLFMSPGSFSCMACEGYGVALIGETPVGGCPLHEEIALQLKWPNLSMLWLGHHGIYTLQEYHDNHTPSRGNHDNHLTWTNVSVSSPLPVPTATSPEDKEASDMTSGPATSSHIPGLIAPRTSSLADPA